MRVNYHTHTARCGHATGTEDEYIKAAVEAGIKILGFSDHTPYVFHSGHISSGYHGVQARMLPEELPAYADTVRQKQSQYQGVVDIHLGLEAEYYPAYFDDLLLRLRDNGIEYLILGQHWSNNEIGQPHNFEPTESKQQLEMYCNEVIDAMHTGLFTYIAHPDMISFIGDDRFYDTQMRRICREAVACGIPLEINLLGLGQNRSYPTERFWRIAAEEGNQAILGRDAHSPDAFLDHATVRRARSFAENLGIPITENIALIKI